MPRFQYQGRNASGEKVQGAMEADSSALVAKQLIQAGVTPLSVQTESEAPVDILSTYFKVGYPSLQELALFCSQMHALIRAGVPLVRSIQVVGESITNEKLSAALVEIVTKVKQGRSLGSTLEDYPGLFPFLLIALIKVGENTGSLDLVFQQAANHFERELNTRKRLKAATRYPLMVVIAMAIAIGIINILVIPTFSSFFAQFHAQLPLPTRILIGVSNFTVNHWPWILLVLVLMVSLLLHHVRTPQGHYQWDCWKIRLPLLGSIIKRTLLARFARTFALCVRTGVPLLEAIGLIADSTDNVYVSDKIARMRNDIEHGESLTMAARRSQMFTPLVLQMILIGEEAGEVDRLLEEVSTYYEQTLDYEIKQLGDYVEPLLLGVLAFLVLLLALGVYLPMWDISRAAFGK